MPSYSCCAIIIVFLTGNRAACCSLLVMKGGTAFFLRSFVATDATVHVAPRRSARTVSDSAWLVTLMFEPPRLSSFASNSGGTGPARRAVMFQVLFGDEALDLALAVHGQLQRDRLHAPGAEAAADLVPEQRADLVADEPIEHAPRLLRVDHLLVDDRRMLERGEHPLLGDLVEHQPANLLLVAAAELLRQVPADGLAFAVGVGRDEDVVGSLRGVLQLLEHFLPAGDDLVRRLEAFLDVDAQLALRQITDMAHRGDDRVVLAEIFVDGLRLGGRLHHDQCLCHKKPNLRPYHRPRDGPSVDPGVGAPRANRPPPTAAICPRSSSSINLGSSFEAAVPVASTSSSSR